MFSLFRSSKLFRFGYGVTKRSISLQSVKLSTFLDKSTNLYNIKNGQFTFNRAFATAVYKERLSVEKSLHQLDHEVRSRGRISAKDIEEVIEAINYTGIVSSSQALLLIRCCGNLAIEEPPERRTALVAKVMSTLKKLNVQLDISHYNALLKVYLENKTDFLPFEFLKELEASNLRPNRVTYQYLIGTFCIKGDITGATKILELMKENKVPINENIFNFLIMGHSEANDIDSASDIINIMKEKGIEPSASSYAALLCGYAKCGDIEKLRQTIAQCEKEEIYLLDKDYLDIIYALSVSGHEKHVDEFIGKMKKYAGYNQEVVNLVFRLLGEKKDEIVLKMVKSMVSVPGVDHKNGLFLIHYLLRNNEPIQRLVYFAKEFRAHGINDFAALIALREMLVHEKEDDAIFMLKNMRDCNIEVRPHYFYPLFCQAGRRKDNRKIVDILRIMRMLSVSRSTITIKNFVLPNFNLRDVKADFGTLYNAGGLNAVFLAEGLFTENIKLGKIEECERLAKNFYLQWDKRWTTPLNRALIQSGNVSAYVNIYAHLHDSYMKEYRIVEDNMSTQSSSSEEEEVALVEEKQDQSKPEELEKVELPFGYDRDKDFGEYVIRRLLETNGGVEFLVPVLKGMLEYGIGIRETSTDKFKSIEDPVALELLNKLASRDLEAKPIVKDTEFSEAFPTMRTLRMSMMRSELNDLDKHFLYVVNQKNVIEAENIFEDCIKNDTATKFYYLNMVKLYTLTRQFDKAYDLSQKMFEKFPDGQDDEPFTELYYIETLMNLNKFDEAAEHFKKIDFSRHNPEILFNHILKRYIAENKDLSRLPELMDIALEKKISVPRHYSIITFAHLERKEYEKAVEIFEHVAKNYRYPVIKTQLLKEIVLNGNASLLERVTNALADVNGQMSSLLDLVGTFAECNKPKQARRLLETPGLNLWDGKLDTMCKKFVELGNVQAVQCLVNATKGLTLINRAIMYNYLLESAIELNDPAKALNLWTEMQEEDLTPSDAFLRKLGTFLKSKGLPVPFAVSEIDLELDSRGNVHFVNSFKKALEEKDFEKICKIIDTASRYGKYIPYSSLAVYLKDELIAKGDYEKVAQFRRLLPKFKPYLTYDGIELLTYGNANEIPKFLEKKIVELSKLSPEVHHNRFPTRALLNTLFRKTELLGTIEELNIEAKKKNIKVFSDVLWSYHYINGNLEESEKFYQDSTLKHCFYLVKKYCSFKSLIDPLERLLDARDQFQLDDTEVQQIIGTAINIYKNEKDDAGMQKFIDGVVEKGYQHLIPSSRAGTEAQSSSQTTAGFQEEEEIFNLESEGTKAGSRTFKETESEGLNPQNLESRQAEEPLKPQTKTESI